MLELYFNNFYDIKEMKRDVSFLAGGLSKVAKELDVYRVGTMHQAGSDSIVTSGVFFTLQKLLIQLQVLSRPSLAEDERKGQVDTHLHSFNRVIYGLGSSVNEEQYIENYKSMTQEQQ